MTTTEQKPPEDKIKVTWPLTVCIILCYIFIAWITMETDLNDGVLKMMMGWGR